MAKGERALIDWLKQRSGGSPARVELSIGDDMAALRLDGSRVLITSDMLLDGVHFRTGEHRPEQIGRKAIACSLSDCAAMAVRPIAAVVSVALPESADMDFAQTLFAGMQALATAFDCAIVGGDTTAWANPLAIDVAMLAEPWPDRDPVRRDGGRAGDRLYVTGSLGGSLAGHHLDFVPRVAEAHTLTKSLGPNLHAMMDLSDGLALDLSRLCEASGCGAELYEAQLEPCISDAAKAAALRDGRTPLEHALQDGEDFELLLAVDPSVTEPPLGRPVGVLVESGLTLIDPTGRACALKPIGYEHFK